MNRRRFIQSGMAVASAGSLASTESRILLPTDTPDELGFRIMWYNPVLPIDKSTYQLKLEGLIDKPLEMSLDQLRAYPQQEQSSRLKCVQCWSSRTTWNGFRFGELMEDVKPSPKVKAVRFDSSDGWFEYMSMEEMQDPKVMLCLGMAGKPLTDQHGAPLRLLVPFKYGYKSAKLITKITFVEKGEGSMACDIGPYYSPSGEILPGYDHPLDLGLSTRKKILGGEITAY